jgi:hypothetical protein
MKKFLLLGCLLVWVVLLSLPAHGALLNAPVPSNAYIVYNGLDWAWASPCSGPACGTGFGLDLSYQSTFGWHVPSAAELALAPPNGSDFVFAGANVPLGAVDPVSGAFESTGTAPGDIAIAVPYFNTIYTWADYSDSPGGLNNLPWNTLGAYVDPSGNHFDYSEFLVVRSKVPEPSTMLLLAGGLLGLVTFRKKLRK